MYNVRVACSHPSWLFCEWCAQQSIDLSAPKFPSLTVDGELAIKPIEPPATPLPEPDPERVMPCCERLGYSAWCVLPDGHKGAHEGPPPVYGPLEQFPRIGNNIRGWG